MNKQEEEKKKKKNWLQIGKETTNETKVDSKEDKEDKEEKANPDDVIGDEEEYNEETDPHLLRLKAKSKSEEKREKRKARSEKSPEENNQDDIKALKQKNDRLSQEIEGLRASGNPAIAKIAGYIKEKYGDVTEATVEEYIKKNKLRKTDANELRTSLDAMDAKVKDLDIRSSEDFQKQYTKPLNDAYNGIYASIVQIGKDNKPIQPALFQSIVAQVTKDIDKIDPVEAKRIYGTIAKIFKDQTGEEYDGGTLSDFTRAIREYREAKEASDEAYKDWDNKRQQAKRENELETERQNEILNRRAKSLRHQDAIKAIAEFEFDDEVISIEEVEEAFNDAHSKNEEMISSGKFTDYNISLTRSAKANLFDKIYDDYVRLKKAEEEGEEINREEHRGNGSKVTQKTEKAKPGSWTTMGPKPKNLTLADGVY